MKRASTSTMDYRMTKKSSVDPKYKAAAIVKRFWNNSRDATTSRAVKRFAATGPNGDRVQSISFDSLVVMLREKPVIDATRTCLQRIHMLTTFRHGSPSKALAPENVNVRVFLAGYMVAYRPTHVFESMGTLEQALCDAAKPLLAAFERIWRLLLSGKSFSEVPHQLTRNFPTLLFEYLKRFKAWKVPDEAKLTCRIKHALIALYQAHEHLPPDEPEDSKLNVEFRTQIERLRTKLQQIAGADALRAFDEERAKDPMFAAGGGGGGNGGGAGSAYAALPGRMTNEQLAHELLLDPKFQLDESGGCSVENPAFHRIRESFHRAFWDSLVDDLKLDAPCYVRVLRVLSEIRDGVADIAGGRAAADISEVIDLDFIKHQAEAGLYGWDSCRKLFACVVAVIQSVQLPKRDSETANKWRELNAEMDGVDMEGRPRALCHGLEFLLDRVNAMRIDAANSRLRLISPVVKDHGVEYERDKFQTKLQDGTYTLERTTQWIYATIRREVESNDGLQQQIANGAASAFLHIHSAAMLALVTDPVTIKGDMCPETLLFDVFRLGSYQHEFRQQTTAAALFVTASHMLPAGDALTAISSLVKTEDWAPTVEAIEEILVQKNKADGAVLKALRQCVEPSDSVHKLIGQRLRTLWWTKMRGEQPKSCSFVRAVEPLVPRIDKAIAKLNLVAGINRAVHAPIYNVLIRGQVAAQ